MRKELWVFFLDLSKAFDCVQGRTPLEYIYLLNFCYHKLISLLKALHVNSRVIFTVDEMTQMLGSITGVKQGEILVPVLAITFFIVVVMIIWKANCNVIPATILDINHVDFLQFQRYFIP